ncbi:MAG: zinc ribbon domain-containing protein [Dehalococcoidia bacterium]|jgi:putative FmdB family regulatory protein|nr:zinc ribbon domain-containing protein [Dehalococcoidia bacterium]
MPIYEYACTTCRSRFERMRSMDTSQEPSPCPDCGSPSPRALSVFTSFMKSPGGDLVPVGGASDGLGCGDGCACSAGMEF